MKNRSILSGILLLTFILTSCTGNRPAKTPTANSSAVAAVVSTMLAAIPTATPQPQSTATHTPEPISLCRSDATSFPGITHFTPVDSRGAIAYSSDYLLDGLTLIFPDSGEIMPLQQLKKQGLTGAIENISWSPDGTKIVFWYSEAGLSGNGYLMIADLSLGEVCAITDLVHYMGPTA